MNTSRLRQNLECPICYTDFNLETHLPVILKCGHSICQYSAENLINQNKITCPICKKNLYYNY